MESISISAGGTSVGATKQGGLKDIYVIGGLLFQILEDISVESLFTTKVCAFYRKIKRLLACLAICKGHSLRA